MIREMPILEYCVDVDYEASCVERTTDPEIVAEILNNRVNLESEDDNNVTKCLSMSLNRWSNELFKLLIASDASFCQWMTVL